MEEGNNSLYMIGDGGRKQLVTKQLFVHGWRWRKETIVCKWSAMEEGNTCLYMIGDGGRKQLVSFCE
jgi:hypothetical protein